MGIFILLGVIVFGAGLILLIARSLRGSGPVIPMVRVAIASNPTEMEMWGQHLKVAGIPFRVQGMRSPVPQTWDGRWLADDYSIELWVRASDEEAARKLLGLRD